MTATSTMMSAPSFAAGAATARVRAARGGVGGAAALGARRGGRARGLVAAPVRALPETSEIAEQGVEGYVAALEQAYGDEALGNEVRDRMADDRQFSIGIRQAMTDPK